MLTNLRYNTRAWELNGHTLTELADVVSNREIEGLLSYGLEENYFPAIKQAKWVGLIGLTLVGRIAGVELLVAGVVIRFG